MLERTGRKNQIRALSLLLCLIMALPCLLQPGCSQVAAEQYGLPSLRSELHGAVVLQSGDECVLSCTIERTYQAVCRSPGR